MRSRYFEVRFTFGLSNLNNIEVYHEFQQQHTTPPEQNLVAIPCALFKYTCTSTTICVFPLWAVVTLRYYDTVYPQRNHSFP